MESKKKNEGETNLDASKKTRSRHDRKVMHEHVHRMMTEMIDPKLIAYSLRVSQGYVYQRIKDQGYRRCFITAEERVMIHQFRAEKMKSKLLS